MRVKRSSDVPEAVVGVDEEGVALVDLDGRRTAMGANTEPCQESKGERRKGSEIVRGTTEDQGTPSRARTTEPATIELKGQKQRVTHGHVPLTPMTRRSCI